MLSRFKLARGRIALGPGLQTTNPAQPPLLRVCFAHVMANEVAFHFRDANLVERRHTIGCRGVHIVKSYRNMIHSMWDYDRCVNGCVDMSFLQR